MPINNKIAYEASSSEILVCKNLSTEIKDGYFLSSDG